MVGRRAAVLGSPIAHSLSPVLHRAAYEVLGLDWSYDAVEVDEAGLAEFVAGCDDSWVGLSLTMPLKRAIIPLCDEVSETALEVEAVNTVLLRADGRRAGENTDVPGILSALREAGVGPVSFAAVLGGGATAASALAALRELGAGDVAVYVRSEARAEEVRRLADRLGVPAHPEPWEAAAKGLSAPLVIATTPAGTTDGLAEHVPAEPGLLFDVLYHPWPTQLAAAWAAAGGQVVGGLDLLVHQAVLQVELMLGEPIDRPAVLAAMRSAGEAALLPR